MNRRRFLASLGSLAAAGCGTSLNSAAGDAETQPPPAAQTIRPLQDLVPSGKLRVGTAAERPMLEDPALAAFVRANFNLLTPGRELKWDRVHPAPDRYDFSGADWMVDFASKNAMAVHGHNLCWNTSNPAWLAATATKANAAGMLSDHIKTVMGRYRGRIASWDVVNEPIRLRFHRPDGMMTGPWLDALGPEYIDLAFHAAAEADPGALRVLNIDSVEQDSSQDAIRAASLTLIRSLVARKVPVQAVGLESHLDGSRLVASPGRDRFIGELRGLGLEVLITELDVNDTYIQGSFADRRRAVAEVYGDYLRSVLPAAGARQCIFWSPSDKNNWLDAAQWQNKWYMRADHGPHFPGLLDASLHPNPALAAVAGALGGVA